MSNVISCGGVLIKKEDGVAKICLISLYPLSPKYVFPKGHQEAGETNEQTALREVREEIGLDDLKIIKYLGVETRESTERNSKIVIKDIHLFLMTSDNFIHHQSEESYKWFTFNEAPNSMLAEESNFLMHHQAEINEFIKSLLLI